MTEYKQMGDMCLYCRLDTKFGSGRFVNRIPAWNETEEGYMCPDCQIKDLPEDRDERILDLIQRLDEWDEEDLEEGQRETYKKELDAMSDDDLEQEYYDVFYQ